MKLPLLPSALILTLGLAAPAQAVQINIIDLVTDDQGVNPAKITDANLKNAWGMSSNGVGSPFWISDNATGVSTLYSVNGVTNAVTKVALTEVIPGDGSVTGQVFNSVAGNFTGGGPTGSNFMFVSEDGTISGRIGAGTSATALQAASPDNVYKGAAYAISGGNPYLYAANFRAGTIDVVKGNGGAPNLAGNFVDPNLPSGYAPFNIQNLGGKLYVTYALQDGAKKDEVAGAGNGFVSVFDVQGNFLGRVASGGSLDAPWGLAIAPASFRDLAGDLLVGNFGDGTISAFDLATSTFAGSVLGVDGNPLMIDGLWGLMVGNGGNTGSANKIYFTAGPNDEQNGLFGVLEAVPEPATLVLFGLGLTGLGVSRRRRA